MAIHPDVVWFDRHGGAAVKVDQVGLRVAVNGGRWSPDLTDVDELRKLHELIGDLLYEKTGVR